MSVYDQVSDLVEALVAADPALALAINTAQPGWIDVGAPLAAGEQDASFPCVRLAGLVQDRGKWTTYTLMLTLWSQDQSSAFLDLAGRLGDALQSSDQLQCETWLHRPEQGLNGAVYPLTYC